MRPAVSLSLISLGCLLIVACDAANTNRRACVTGEEHCACYANNTCNGVLVCVSEVCTGVDGGSEMGGASAGTGGTGGGTSSSVDTGGVTSVDTGGTAATTGGTTDNTLPSTGGATDNGGGANTGGAAMTETGGSVGANGGTSAAGTGGSETATGGTDATGGAQNATGGTDATGGTQNATGGTTALGSGGSTAQLGPNLITNGDFSQGTTYWHVTSSNGIELTTASASADGACCVAASTSYTSQVMGWPVLSADATYLQPGSSYMLTFRAEATSTAYILPKVGAVASPYTAVFQATTSSAVPTSWQTFQYPFTFSTSSTLTASSPLGVAITVSSFYSGQVCIDDVVLALVQ